MKVWRQLQKQLHGDRREQQVGDNLTFSSSASSSSASSLQIGGFVKQQTSASVFYLPVDDDGDDVSVIGLTGMESNSRSHTMEKNSVKGRDENLMNSRVNSNSSAVSVDVSGKPAVLPKPNKALKPKQQQQRQIADLSVTESLKQNTRLIMCPRGTLYPPPSCKESAQETTKPQPPVRYQSFSVYTVSHKKRAIKLLYISLANINRFSTYFQWHTLWTVCNNAIIKYPTAP